MPLSIFEFLQQISDSSANYAVNYSIFTDGSRQHVMMPYDSILNTRAQNDLLGTTSAAIVAIADDENWAALPIHALFIEISADCLEYDAYIAELVALSIAVHVATPLQNAKIYSDCQAAISTINRAFSSMAKKNCLCDVMPFIRFVSSLRSLPAISWIPSHPERRLGSTVDWEYLDWGNYIADMVAKGSLQQIMDQFKTIRLTTVPMIETVCGLIEPDTWYWSKKHVTVPLSYPVQRIHDDHRPTQYLLRRDADRTLRGEPSRWIGTSLALAALCWKKIASGVLGSNIALRNVLDKHWHGRNRCKGLVGQEAVTQRACQHCNAPDSQQHIILECPLHDLQVIRDYAQLQLNGVAQQLQNRYKANKYALRVIAFISASAFNPHYKDYDRLWTGAWNATVLHTAFIFEVDPSENFPALLSHEQICLLQRIIVAMTTPLIQALIDLMRTHRLTNASQSENSELGNTSVQSFSERDFSPSNGSNVSTQNDTVTLCNVISSTSYVLHKPQLTEHRERRLKKALQQMNADSIDSSLYNDMYVGGVIVNVSHPHGATCSCDYDKD